MANIFRREGVSGLSTSNLGLFFPEICSKIKITNLRIPLPYSWYFGKFPDRALIFKSERIVQVTISRLLREHFGSLTYIDGQKIFQTCTKSSTAQTSRSSFWRAWGYYTRNNIQGAPKRWNTRFFH